MLPCDFEWEHCLWREFVRMCVDNAALLLKKNKNKQKKRLAYSQLSQRAALRRAVWLIIRTDYFSLHSRKLHPEVWGCPNKADPSQTPSLLFSTALCLGPLALVCDIQSVWMWKRIWVQPAWQTPDFWHGDRNRHWPGLLWEAQSCVTSHLERLLRATSPRSRSCRLSVWCVCSLRAAVRTQPAIVHKARSSTQTVKMAPASPVVPNKNSSWTHYVHYSQTLLFKTWFLSYQQHKVTSTYYMRCAEVSRLHLLFINQKCADIFFNVAE